MILMNPKDEEEEEEAAEEIGRMQTDVTDEDMAQRCRRTGKQHQRLSVDLKCHRPDFYPLFSLRYESFIASVRKKFAKKRDRAAAQDDDVNQNTEDAKRVFLKPQD